MSNEILTYTGKLVDPFDLQPEDICIEDIAHSLACSNRFNGHTREPLSIAQHSFYVSALCEPVSPLDALQGLLHDASEAYLGDIVGPVKRRLGSSVWLTESQIQCKIFIKFDCPWILTPAVKEADDLMLRFEGETFFLDEGWWLGKSGLLPVTIEEMQRLHKLNNTIYTALNWQVAEEAFLRQYRYLLYKLERS